MELEFNTREIESLLKKLAGLEPKLKKRIERRVLRKSLKEAQLIAESKAPVGPPKGSLKARIKSSFQVKTRTRKGAVYGNLKNTAPHAHLQEMGWFLTKGPRGGKQKVIGTVGEPYTEGPRPFMRPALDEKGEQILRDLQKEMWEELKKLEVK